MIGSHYSSSEGRTQRKKDKEQKKKGCFGYLERFDEYCMKPIFIHKYTKEKEQEADTFANDFTADGGKLVESEYGRSITTLRVRRRREKKGGSVYMKAGRTTMVNRDVIRQLSVDDNFRGETTRIN